MVGPATVGRVRQRFVEGGLQRALDLPAAADNGVNSMESRKPTWWPWPAVPEGHTRWTLRLLAL